jgi:transposase
MLLQTTKLRKETLQMKYIGMDAHSRTCTFVVLAKSGKVLSKATVETREDKLLAFIRSVKGPKKLAYEEGVMSQWLYMLFKDEVDELVVCQPQEKKGPKTDEIDAHELADLLRVGWLKSVFHADSVLMNLRISVSGYDDVIQEIARAKNRYKDLFRQVAIPTDAAGFYKSEQMLLSLDSDERYYVACTLFEQIALLEEQRLGYVERFEANARRYQAIRLLMSIPGIGPVRANQIVAILVTPYRFATKYNLFSYSVLTKHNRISDGKLYGKKQALGHTELKRVFKSAALSAIKSNNAFRRKYDEMRAAGKDDRAARNAVAKKIAATVLGVWKSGKKYNDKHEEVTQRRNRNCHSGAREALS